MMERGVPGFTIAVLWSEAGLFQFRRIVKKLEIVCAWVFPKVFPDWSAQTKSAIHCSSLFWKTSVRSPCFVSKFKESACFWCIAACYGVILQSMDEVGNSDCRQTWLSALGSCANYSDSTTFWCDTNSCLDQQLQRSWQF